MPTLFPTDPARAIQTLDRSTQTSFPRAWQFDFDVGDFVTDSAGRVAEAEGVEAYIIWVHKTLRSERYRHLIYGRQHGAEIESLLRQNLRPGVLESELTRTITESLMVDPRTKKVGDFVFTRRGSTLDVSFTITTARGDSVSLTVPIGG